MKGSFIWRIIFRVQPGNRSNIQQIRFSVILLHLWIILFDTFSNFSLVNCGQKVIVNNSGRKIQTQHLKISIMINKAKAVESTYCRILGRKCANGHRVIRLLNKIFPYITLNVMLWLYWFKLNNFNILYLT